MPKTIKNRRAASATRRGVNPGNNKKKSGRKGTSRPKPEAPAVIANSLFALTLKPISGITVECQKSEVKGVARIYSDILKCYKKLAPDHNVSFPDEMPVEKKLEKLVRFIRLALSEDHSFNFDQVKNEYCLTIYHECKYVNWLPIFEVGAALLKLKKNYPKLYEVFVLFLQTFRYKLALDGWWEWPFQQALERFEDMRHQDEEDLDPQWVEHATAENELYTKGDAYKYQLLIIKKSGKPTSLIRSHLKRLRKQNPLIKLIERGCEIIDANLNMFSFGYRPEGEDETSRYHDEWTLRFENQAMIHWNADGLFAEEYGEYIDSMANEAGIDSPVYSKQILPNQKEDFDFKAFKTACEWPWRLAMYFSDLNSALIKYCKK